MTWLDFVVIAVLVLSIAWGIWRGLVREVMSLAGWVIAFLAANLFAGPLADTLPQSARLEVRLIIAFLVIFLAALLAASLAAILLGRVIHAVGLGSTDRVLGALFGFARALVIVVAFALVAGLTSIPKKPVWTNSASGGTLERAALSLKGWLPPAFAERLRYH